MNHETAASFWDCYDKLPVEIQKLVDKNFQLLKKNAAHPSLHFKKVVKFWSARVGSDYRALATKIDDGFLWVWIGTHTEYDKLIS